MAGQIKKMINTIIESNAKGDRTIESTTKTKLILRGVNPNLFNETSFDDPVVIEKLKAFAKEMNIKL